MTERPTTPWQRYVRPQGRNEVATLDLLFDLVYVFAISQLSHHLLVNLGWEGAAQTAILFSAVSATWMASAWTSTLLDPTSTPLRMMLLAGMVIGLFMNAGIESAFEQHAWLFASTYLLINIGRTVGLLVVRLHPVMQHHTWRVLIWMIATAPLWVAGAFASPEARLLLWAVAAAIDLIGTVIGHPVLRMRTDSRGFEMSGEHLIERCGLFFIIALGETVLTTGVAITESPLTALTFLTGTVSIVGTVALWWLYFRPEAPEESGLRESDVARDGRYAMSALRLMVAGLIAIAVSDELIIAEPLGENRWAIPLLTCGGPALILGAQAWYMNRVGSPIPRSRPIGIGLLALVGVATVALPPLLTTIGATVVIIAVAVSDHRSATRAPAAV